MSKYDNIKVVTICGSMRFAEEMMVTATKLETEKGYCVIQCVYDKSPINSDEAYKNIVDAHFKKIDISDAIYVMNIGGYIGSSTTNEINYALENGKEVLYHEPK